MMGRNIKFSVSGLPPKKDGANSMWRKPVEVDRIKALRHTAYRAMKGQSLAQSWVHLALRIYADPADGDLDNFITGICDGLMAVHPRTPWNEADWSHVDPVIQPMQPIIYENDKLLTKISAERLTPDSGRRYYEIVLDFE